MIIIIITGKIWNNILFFLNDPLTFSGGSNFNCHCTWLASQSGVLMKNRNWLWFYSFQCVRSFHVCGSFRRTQYIPRKSYLFFLQCSVAVGWFLVLIFISLCWCWWKARHYISRNIWKRNMWAASIFLVRHSAHFFFYRLESKLSKINHNGDK